MLGRKELFKNTLRKTAYAWKRIIELRLTGEFLLLGGLCNLWPFSFQKKKKNFLLIILYYCVNFIFTEEEASRLRSYVDQPAFTDLHWV